MDHNIKRRGMSGYDQPNKNTTSNKGDDFGKYCRDIPDFPKPGIIFKDITNLLKNGPVFKRAIDVIAGNYSGQRIDSIVCIEARGFIIGSALAYRTGSGIIPVRKKGKLPWNIFSENYSLEYGQDVLEIHQDSIEPGQRVLIVDDLIATGGTIEATAKLIRKMKGEIIGAAFLIELVNLKGKEKLPGIPVFSLIKF
jgi:adenine phosphoribosyltransferase